MSLRHDLRQLSKNELINIIIDLKERLERVEAILNAYENPHTPSGKVRSKKNTVRDESKPRFPGKPEGGNGGGIDMPAPNKEERVSMNACPNCCRKLGKPYDTYSFTQMDIPEPGFVTTRYVVEMYKCKCGLEVDAGEGLHKGFYGPNVTALMGVLKKEGLSYASISGLLQDVHKLPISHVGVYGKLVKLTQVMGIERERIRKAVRKHEYVNMDETGLREDGRNGYVWSASTPLHCLFEYNFSRGGEVAQGMLPDFKGVIVTDDYKGYLWALQRQLCWAHLLREAKDFAENNGAMVQYERLKTLYDKARRAQEVKNIKAYDKLAWELEDIATCYHPLDGCKTMYGKLHNRAALWLLGVKQSNVPLTNNHAERCLRKVVLHRNRIGCIRNKVGEAFVNVFLSCTSTWKLQGKSTYQQLLNYALAT